MRLFTPMIFFSLLVLTGCKNILLIERNESVLSAQTGNKKIICIDPRFYFENDALNSNLFHTAMITESIKKDIIKFSKKNSIELELYDINTKSTNSYYEDLLSLKNNMIAVNFNQQTPLNFNTRLEENKTHQKVFVYPPKIAYDFNALSTTYNTPYFSYLGIYFVKGKIVLYHIVVDTDKAETVYREYRIIEKELHKDIIAQMIYDSYASLAKQLKN